MNDDDVRLLKVVPSVPFKSLKMSRLVADRWETSPSGRSNTFSYDDLPLDNDELGEETNSDKLEAERDSLVSYVGNLDKEIEKQREFCDNLTRDVYNQVQLKYSLIIEEQQNELHRFVELVEKFEDVNHELGNKIAEVENEKAKLEKAQIVNEEKHKKAIEKAVQEQAKLDKSLKSALVETSLLKTVSKVNFFSFNLL
jgi:hypothetical protein